MTWNQPLCFTCWVEKEGNRVPARLKEPRPEICCLCGDETLSGIYKRLNPETVPFPKERD